LTTATAIRQQIAANLSMLGIIRGQV